MTVSLKLFNYIDNADLIFLQWSIKSSKKTGKQNIKKVLPISRSFHLLNLRILTEFHWPIKTQWNIQLERFIKIVSMICDPAINQIPRQQIKYPDT